jgi:glucokinase
MSATLVGDVGGTNCRFALAERTAQGTIELHHSEKYAVAEFGHFNEAVNHYLTGLSIVPKKAAFAFAGPKFNDAIQMTNVNWLISEAELVSTFNFENAVVLNDFVAMANGATVIPDDGFQTLISGKVNYNKSVAVLGPGTGLGISCIVPGRPPRILATEGGHTAFAPQTELEREILAYTAKKHGYVAAETLICGPGMTRLYEAISAIYDEPTLFSKPAEIVAAAEASPKSVARKTVLTFCDILGGFAGNAALTLGAAGGVVVGGGVSRHIAPFIAESDFEGHFKNKGPGSWYVKDIPVRLIMAHYVALYGAAAMVLPHSAAAAASG